jgi:hypothetical protein
MDKVISKNGSKSLQKDDDGVFYLGTVSREYDELTGKTFDNAFNGIEVYTDDEMIQDVCNSSRNKSDIDELYYIVSELSTVKEFLAVAKEYIK